MATNLTGETIKDTYTQLLHIDGGPTASEKSILSGNGTPTALKVGTSSATVEGDLVVNGSLSASEGIELTTTLPIEQGGTGAETVAGARSNLGLGSMAVINSPVPVANGGTGATDTATARANLGLGTMALQSSANVSITGGTIDSNVLTNQVYGQFVSNSDQTSTANTPALITFDSTNVSEGVSISSQTDITFSQAGVYKLFYNLQLVNIDASDAHSVYVWQRLNGSDINGTAKRFVVPSTGNGGFAAISISTLIQLGASDEIQLVWATDDGAVSLYHNSAQVNPFAIPVIPSALFNALKIA